MPRQRSEDPKKNAGISLTETEIDKLNKFAKEAGLETKSAVVSFLIHEYLPSAWWNLELKKSKKSK